MKAVEYLLCMRNQKKEKGNSGGGEQGGEQGEKGKADERTGQACGRQNALGSWQALS